MGVAVQLDHDARDLAPQICVQLIGVGRGLG